MLQLNLFPPTSDWEPPAELPDWRGMELAIDEETKDIGITEGRGAGWATGEGYVVGYAVASERGSLYLPIRHDGGGNMDPGLVRRWVQEHIDRAPTIVCHNALYDMGWATEDCINIDWEKVHDTMVAAPLLDENRWSYSLDSLADTYLGLRKDETLLKEAAATYGLDAKADLWRLHASFVGAYGEQDAAVTLKLWQVLKKEMEKEELTRAYEVEIGIQEQLYHMRKRGIRVDETYVALFEDNVVKKIEALSKEIKRLSGYAPNVNSSESVAVLFEKAGIEYPKTPKTNKPSINAQLLSEAAGRDKAIGLVLESRQLHHLLNTYIRGSIHKFIRNGRIHAETHQLKSDEGGTVSYRFSYSNPPLQQWPARGHPEAAKIRDCFVPERGESWAAVDYSQQELRWTVSYAKWMNCAGVDLAVDKYNKDPNTDFHQLAADIMNVSRSDVKPINFGVLYGMGEAALCRNLGLPLVFDDKKGRWVAGPEGKDLLEKYYDNMPFVKQLEETCKETAKTRGYIRLVDGRRCRFPMWEPSRYGAKQGLPAVPYWKAKKFKEDPNHPWYRARLVRAFIRKGLNRLIQGTSACQAKRAMLLMWKQYKIVPLLQMHDEFGKSYDDPKVIKQMVECMQQAYDAPVPWAVDAERGPTWGQAKEKIEL